MIPVATLQNAYSSSTSPEIITDATRLGVTVRRGSGADTDVIIEGQNGAGSTTFSVNGNGAATFGGKLSGVTGGTATGEVMTQDQFGTNYDDLHPTGNPDFGSLDCVDLNVTNNIGANGTTIGVGATAGLGCTAMGAGSLASNASGTNNVAYGNSALNALTTGIDNVAVGNSCGAFLTDAAHNVIGGTGAGRLTNAAANVTSITNCVVLGDAARVSGSSDTNEIVIGDDARGEGSNTIVIGNTDTTSCHLFGTPKFGDGTDETKTATLDLSGITTGTNRAFALPDASGTVVIGGGTCSGASSGTNTGDQTSVTGNAGTATALATSRTIGGSSFDGTANVTSFPEPGAIGGTTPSTGRFTRVGVGVAASGAASALLCIGGNPVNFTGANYAAVVDATNGGALVLSKDSTNYSIWQYSNASGAFTSLTVEGGTAYTTTMVLKTGSILLGGTTLPSGATRNFVYEGGSTSPVLGAATADLVSTAGVDNGAGNREWQVQPESGGIFALGNNKFRRVPSANQDVYEWTPTVNTTDGTQTTLATIAITASRTYLVTARVVARRTGGSSGTADDGASYERRATYTTKSGTVTLMGSVQTLGTDAEDQAGWDVTLDISTTNVRVRVTGATNNNVTWMGDITVQSVAS